MITASWQIQLDHSRWAPPALTVSGTRTKFKQPLSQPPRLDHLSLNTNRIPASCHIFLPLPNSLIPSVLPADVGGRGGTRRRNYSSEIGRFTRKDLRCHFYLVEAQENAFGPQERL